MLVAKSFWERFAKAKLRNSVPRGVGIRNYLMEELLSGRRGDPDSQSRERRKIHTRKVDSLNTMVLRRSQSLGRVAAGGDRRQVGVTGLGRLVMKLYVGARRRVYVAQAGRGKQ